jgi:protein-S-isoprenylcysteine O-methyltransferase Ste14
MSKAIAFLGSALFFVIAPLALAVVVPWWITGWQFQPAFLGAEPTRILGGVFIIAGVGGLVDSFARFALEGLGTPPVAPTQKLIVTGLYRYVRNYVYRGRRRHFGSGAFVWR